MSGKAGRSGRKPAPKTLIDRMLARSEPHLPDIWQGMVDLAKGVKIGTINENGQAVNVYSKPPDKEAAAEILNRHFGKPRIELDQRLRTEIQISADDYMRALQQAHAQSRMLPSGEFGSPTSPERQLTSPTREESHDPVLQVDITAPFERDVAEGLLWGHLPSDGHSVNQTDSVNITDPDLDASGDCPGGWLDGAGI